MSGSQERLVDELQELTHKVDKLEEFTLTTVYQELGENMQELMEYQLEGMKQYQFALFKRMELL